VALAWRRQRLHIQPVNYLHVTEQKKTDHTTGELEGTAHCRNPRKETDERESDEERRTRRSASGRRDETL
jgi:hypothetical protein